MKRLKIVLSLAALVCGCLGKVHAQTPGRHFELRAETPAFWNLIDHDATITKVAGESDLGRQRLPNPLHRSHHIGISVAHQGARIRPIIVTISRNYKAFGATHLPPISASSSPPNRYSRIRFRNLRVFTTKR